MYGYLELLLHIAKKKGLFRSLESSTLKISKELGMSQQTVSRKLREMEENGLVKRSASPNGLVISLDDKGRVFLQQNYQTLSEVFKVKKKGIAGIVLQGIGEGAYYVSQKGYKFKEKLGFDAYPGTLNLRVEKEEFMLLVSNLEAVRIDGFKTKERSFGALACYKVNIKGVQGAIVMPERTRHGDDVIEIIAPVNLRSKLGLNDEDKVKIE